MLLLSFKNITNSFLVVVGGGVVVVVVIVVVVVQKQTSKHDINKQFWSVFDLNVNLAETFFSVLFSKIM